MFMSLPSMLKARIEFKRNFAKNNTNSEREHTRMSRWLEFLFMVSWELYAWRFAKETQRLTNHCSHYKHWNHIQCWTSSLSGIIRTSMQVHTCWYLEYWSTVWHLCSFVNCDNWEMMGLLEAILQELDFRGRFVSKKGYMQHFSFLNRVHRYCLSWCGLKRLKPCIQAR